MKWLGPLLRQSTKRVWNRTRSNPVKMEQLQFLQMGANEGQWNRGIEDIGKRNGHDGHGIWAKRRVLIGRKWMGQRTRGLDEMEQIILGILECQSRKSRQYGYRQ